MSKQDPVIIQFEPDENYQTVADLIVFNMGLTINSKAYSVKTAKELFEKIEKGGLKPDIAIVDSFLERDHNDGAQVAKKLKEISPDIKIIRYSVIPDESWGDYNAVKSSKDTSNNLVQVLEQITGKNFRSDNAAD